ncbi:MAG: hypothetical protein QOG48_413 [Verrucomicrobiota bacterium]|jgi:hypothetical protein
MKSKDRVRANTAAHINREIERRAARHVVQAAGQADAAITRRINELDDEWDMERWLEMNASALAFTGMVLGLLVNKKFFAIPAIVLPFLFQHSVQGWCPPIPILRRRGVRTRREIDAEKYALKAVRGDFVRVHKNGDPTEAGRAAWQAANA